MIVNIYLSIASKLHKKSLSHFITILCSALSILMGFVHCFSVSWRYLAKLVPIHLSAILKSFSSSDIHEVLLTIVLQCIIGRLENYCSLCVFVAPKWLNPKAYFV